MTEDIQDTIESQETHHYVSERKLRGRRDTKMQPPLTPMIDVTFQLLLFFLLTMQFREAEGRIPGTLPPVGQGVSASVAKEVKLRIQRTGEGAEYFIGRQSVGVNAPEPLFRTLVNAREQLSADAPLVIEPDFQVPWKYVVEAFAQAVKAKFEKIGFGAVSRGVG